MQELNFKTLVGILLFRLKWLVLVAVAGAMITVGYTALVQEDTYRSDCSMYVMNLTVGSDGSVSTSSISTTNLNAAQDMVEEYIALLRTDMVMDDVAYSLGQKGYSMTNQEILGTLSMASKGGTALLIVNATTADPSLSKAICDSLMDVAPEKVKSAMLDLGTINPVDHAELGVKTTPSPFGSAAVGATAGFIICYGICLLIYLADNTVTSEQDLKYRFDVTVLGMVPDLHPEMVGKKGGKENGQAREKN